MEKNTIIQSNDDEVTLSCKDHGEFTTISRYLLNGNGCKKCNKITTKEIIDRFKLFHKDRFDYSLVEYKGMENRVTIICKKHGKFSQLPFNHLTGQYCKKCRNEESYYTNEEFIKKSVEIHGNKYDYSNVKYLHNRMKVKILCKKHGIFEQTPSSHLQGHGCSICNESSGEKIISSILKDKKIEHNRQHGFHDCKNNRGKKYLFDFYLPENNICIEFDGTQHFCPPRQWGGEDYLNMSKINDSIKNEYCKKNNIKLIRIKYDENVENRLNEELNQIFNSV